MRSAYKVDSQYEQYEHFLMPNCLRCCRIRYNGGSNDVAWFRYRFQLPDDEERTMYVNNLGLHPPNDGEAADEYPMLSVLH